MKDRGRVLAESSRRGPPDVGGRGTLPHVAAVAGHYAPGAGRVCGAVEGRLEVDGELEGERGGWCCGGWC